MGKSNKFDYRSRTSVGVKMGSIIGRDLEKAAAKAIRHTSPAPLAKMLHKAAKPKRESRDTEEQDTDTDTGHKLDLKATGRSLTDEGLFALADGLEEALKESSSLHLVDLNLSDNALTTRSLARLAPIIKLAKLDLQTLDLSKNIFQVANSEQAYEWEQFLRAFAPCRTLRRLDLSDNVHLGSLAFEILARVHHQERSIDAMPAAGASSVLSLADGRSSVDRPSLDFVTDEDESFPSTHFSDPPGAEYMDSSGSLGYAKNLRDACILAYRCGLRSLPYLTLQNVALSDTGALFLSYVIEEHHYPTQLIDELNATYATTPIRTYQQDACDKGIDVDRNDGTIGKDGLNLLKMTEAVRYRKFLVDDESLSSSYASINPADAGLFAGYTEDANAGTRMGAYSRGRRSTVGSIRIESISLELTGLEHARKKIQRNTIALAGSTSVALWRSALQVIALSRRLALITPALKDQPAPMTDFAGDSSVQTEPDPASPVSEPEDMKTPQARSFAAPVPQEIHDALNGLSISKVSHDGPPTEKGFKPSYAATLATTLPHDSEEPEFAILNATPMPITPRVANLVVLSPHRKPVDSVRTHGGHLNGPIKRDDNPRRFRDYQIRKMEEAKSASGERSNGYRDYSHSCLLPLSVCRRIITHAMSPHELNVLSKSQFQHATEWGQVRDTLAQGAEWRKNNESAQVWMLLDAVKCLMYDHENQ